MPCVALLRLLFHTPITLPPVRYITLNNSCSVWLLSQCLDIEFPVHKTSPLELGICTERQFCFWEIWNVLLWGCTVCEFGGCDKKNVPVFCMAPAAQGGAGAWRCSLSSTREEPVVFPHALICDNKKNSRLCFSNVLWVSRCSDLPVTLCAVGTRPSPQSLMCSGSGSSPCFGAGGGWAGLSNQLEPRVLLCSGCSAEGQVLDVPWDAASLFLALTRLGPHFVTSINFIWPV